MSTSASAQHTVGGAPGYALGYAPLVGGEAVPIDLRVARIGSRAVAAIIDFVLQLFALGFLNALVGNFANLDGAAQQAVAVTLAVAVLIGYPVVLEAAWGGRTIGKAAMGLRAARDDGGPLRFRHALVRGLIGVFVEKPGISLGLVAVVCSAVVLPWQAVGRSARRNGRAPGPPAGTGRVRASHAFAARGMGHHARSVPLR